MPKRALLKFRNPDSTKDLNDRFSGLFRKGVFLGGNVVPVSGAVQIDVTPFASVGSDGMIVREDSENTRVSVVSGFKNFVVIRQQYIVNGAPIVSIESLTEVEFNGDGIPGFKGFANPFLIVLAVVDLTAGQTFVNSGNISFLERDSIDILGRSSFRGSVENEVDLPSAGLNINRENDFFIVRNGPDGEPALFSWDGSAWFNLTGSGEVLTLLNEHRSNSFADEKHLTDAQESALSSTTGSGSEALNTSILPFPLPLSEVLLSYNSQASVFSIGETVTGSISGAEGTIAFDSTPGIGDGIVALSNTSGTFTPGESILSGATIRASVNGEPIQNRVVAQQDPKIPTQNENDALLGNFEAANGLEPEPPSSTNRFVTSSKIFAVPSELVFSTPPTNIELSASGGPYFVGTGTAGTAQKWFNLYDFDPASGTEYINSESFPVNITRILTGPPGGPPSGNELNPATDANVDELGFFSATSSSSLFLEVDAVVDTPFRLIFGKRTRLGDMLPELFIARGPESGQVDTSLAQLLLTTPNAVFNLGLFENSVIPGNLVAWNGLQFVKADPNMGLTPIGIRGNNNNLIQEGLFSTTGVGSFNTGPLYADKTNPGQLTVTPNEWFIGIAITSSDLLVNMNAIPLQPSGEVVTPVAFPSSIFDPSVQVGQTVSFSPTNSRFEIADPDNPNRIPIGIRGNNNNVIQNGVFKSFSGNPFTPGVRYYFGRGINGNAGNVTATENDWPLGIAISSNQLFVNSTNAPIPARWSEEHDPDTGHHMFPLGPEVTRDNIVNPKTGQMFIRNDTNPPRIDYFNGISWVSATEDEADVPSGTKMLFAQNFVPTGWSLDNSYSDRVIIVTSSATSGGTTGGSWTITGLTGDPHALSTDEIPAHQHDIRGGSGGSDQVTYNSNGPRGAVNNNNSLGRPTELAGGGQAHEHGVDSDGTWRPSFLTVIVCTKN